MRTVTYKAEDIQIYEYQDAERLIMRLSNEYAGAVTLVSSGGRNRNKIEYYNFPCSFDIETTTIKPGQLDYPSDPDAPPIAFPYLFQWCIFGKVIMCRHYWQAKDIFKWLADYFRLAGNRRLVCFIHNAGYEYHFCKHLWGIVTEKCFALDERHPVTLITKEGFMFRDSYKMTNMSLAALSASWSRHWKKDKEIMDYSQLRTPYTDLDDNTIIYSALDVLSLSDAIIPYLDARGEYIWTKCPTSTSFIRKGLKHEVGIGVKKRNEEQLRYHRTLKDQKVDWPQFQMLLRAARGGNTHQNRKFTGQIIKGCGHGDIISHYPTEMICSPEFPLGVWQPLNPGATTDVIEEFEAGMQCTLFDLVLMDAELKPGVTVPYISISKMGIVEGSGMRFTDNGRYMGGLKAIRITIFGIEWPIIKEQYNFSDAIIIRGYFCRKGYLPDIIRRYVVNLYKQKTELKGITAEEDPTAPIRYSLGKSYVNGCYGMMYTNCLRDTYEVTDEGINIRPEEDPQGFLEQYQNSISYFLCYAWGCIVAALGRVRLQRLIDCCGEDFVYCDTDSVFFRHPEKVWPKLRAMDEAEAVKRRQCGMQISYKDIKGREHELGGIDDEGNCDFKGFGAKKYATMQDGKLTCTIAGVPKKAGSRLIGSLENFQLGFNFKGKDTGKNCLWYNPDPGITLHDEQGRPIEIHANVAMLPCDYLLSLSQDYEECLSIEGNFHWQFKEADKNTINEEDL